MIAGELPCCLAFLCGGGFEPPGPHTCRASTLLTDRFQPYFTFHFILSVGFLRQSLFLQSPACPGTHSIHQVSLELGDPPAFASHVQGLKERYLTEILTASILYNFCGFTSSKTVSPKNISPHSFLVSISYILFTHPFSNLNILKVLFNEREREDKDRDTPKHTCGGLVWVSGFLQGFQ